MRTRVGVLALLVCLSAACGDIKEVSSDGAPPGPDAAPEADAAPPGPCEPGGDPTVEEGYQCLSEAGCSLIARCLPIVTVDVCVQMDIVLFDVRAYIHRALIGEAIEEGIIEYHPDEIAGCYRKVTEMSCAQFFEKEGFDEISLERMCSAVFTGTVAMDGTCYTSLDCESPGAICNKGSCASDTFCCAGTCIFPAAVDMPCGAAPCELGAYCVDGTCRSGEMDAVCGSSSHCDPGLWCSGGTCQAEVESGADCTALEQCSDAEICLIPPGGKSGTCARVDQADAPCNDSCYGFVCVQPDAAELGTCVALLDEEGADCSEFECNTAFECPQASDQCDPRGELGDTCSDEEGRGCKSGPGGGGLFCDSTGHCSAPLPDGEPCPGDEGNNNKQCQSGVCAGETGAKTCQPYPGCYE